MPRLSSEALKRMASISLEASASLEKIIDLMMSAQLSNLWYPSETSQSSYYLGTTSIMKEEIGAVTKVMEAKKIAPENSRLLKRSTANFPTIEKPVIYEILQASAGEDAAPQFLETVRIADQCLARVYLCRGDHSREMAKICTELTEVRKCATTEEKKTALSQLMETFRTGNYEVFRSAHKTWVKDKAPRVEHCMGFLFSYRDLFGARAEWQAAAGIIDSEEITRMRRLVELAPKTIRTLPWAVPDEIDGKGPFKPSELDVPDFVIIHRKYSFNDPHYLEHFSD